MRIVSRVHDYYDCIMKSGFDPNFVWYRNLVCHEEHGGGGLLNDEYQIGIAGKVYDCYWPYEQNKPIWTEEEFNRTYPKPREHRYRWIAPTFSIVENDETFKKYNCPVFIKGCRFRDENGYAKTLILCFTNGEKEDWSKWSDHYRFRDNPFNLKQFDFARIVDPWTAYQDIYSYMSGVLGVNNPVIPEIDDKTMRDIKGFDKHSFVKEGPTKGRKRRKNE